jgi:hypothetical protein
MTIVDTSVWIKVFAPRPLALEAILPFDEVVTCLPIVQEVLQGFRDEAAYQKAKRAMLALPIVESPLQEAVFLEAVDLYRAARRQGLMIRSSVDCLIAACALRNGLDVLHVDRDYKSLAKVCPLRQRQP